MCKRDGRCKDGPYGPLPEAGAGSRLPVHWAMRAAARVSGLTSGAASNLGEPAAPTPPARRGTRRASGRGLHAAVARGQRGRPPAETDLTAVGVKMRILGALAHLRSFQDVCRMLYYLTGIATEKTAELARVRRGDRRPAPLRQDVIQVPGESVQPVGIDHQRHVGMHA